MPINCKIDKYLVVQPYDGTPLSEKRRNRLLTHTTWENLTDGSSGEQSQSIYSRIPSIGGTRVGKTNLWSEKSEER